MTKHPLTKLGDELLALESDLHLFSAELDALMAPFGEREPRILHSTKRSAAERTNTMSNLGGRVTDQINVSIKESSKRNLSKGRHKHLTKIARRVGASRGEFRGPAKWKNISAELRAEYACMALLELDTEDFVTHSFRCTMRLDSEKEGQEQKSLTDWICKRVANRFEQVLARDVATLFVGEPPANGRDLRVYGAFNVKPTEAPLARRALHQALGEWGKVLQAAPGTGGVDTDSWERVTKGSAERLVGKLGYAAGWILFYSEIIGVSATPRVMRQAKALYEGHQHLIIEGKPEAQLGSSQSHRRT